MIPSIAQAGRSFKGASQYYLHDKKAQTNERVAFTETRNLPTNDPHRATAHMIDTATHSNQLKAQSGIKGGRKLEKPVYSYSLSWHPSEKPTQQEQIEAVNETLAVLGLDKHQAIIVAHSDMDHPHVHVIANRVDPETGRALNLGNDRLKLSTWAQEYEEKRGHVFCAERVKNNDGRKTEFVKDQSPDRYQTYAWKKQESGKVWEQYRSDKATASKNNKGQYEALWEQRTNRLTARKGEVKQFFKPQWAKLYKSQRMELVRYDNKFLDRLAFALKTKGSGKVLAFARAVVNDSGNRQLFIDDQKKTRGQLSKEQMQTISDSAREITKAWRYDRDQLKTMHQDQQAERLEQSKSLSDGIWKKAGSDPSKDFGKSNSNDDEKKVRRSTRVKNKLRSDRNKARGRTRKPR